MNDSTQEIELQKSHTALNRPTSPKVIDLTFEDKISHEDDHDEYEYEENFERDTKHKYVRQRDEAQDEECGEEDEEDVKIPKGTVCFIALIVVGGLILTILGFLTYYKPNGSFEQMAIYLVFGLFLLAPGSYCGYLIVRACRAKTLEEKQEYLDQIPI